METKIQFFSDMQDEKSFHFLYLADERPAETILVQAQSTE